ncbi:hypothetical protein LZ30DRAFT_783471 [Colletotrichum cereale]|nr:hypothetical protein LZ30DRAFT_783471 [Colletotrichum cereale]
MKANSSSLGRRGNRRGLARRAAPANRQIMPYHVTASARILVTARWATCFSWLDCMRVALPAGLVGLLIGPRSYNKYGSPPEDGQTDSAGWLNGIRNVHSLSAGGR